ncbi:MAG: hypothetical protein IJF92_01015 [Bacilli bacterium]|nr:hypothetical protein [Bacilli bacterium]
MSKEAFKTFARSHKELADYILNGKTNWQKLYELYEIYGENSSIWNKYFPVSNEDSSITISDLITNIKNVDLDSVQKGIKNIQKTIGLLQDIGIGSNSNTPEVYEPRPMYKYFED